VLLQCIVPLVATTAHIALVRPVPKVDVVAVPQIVFLAVGPVGTLLAVVHLKQTLQVSIMHEKMSLKVVYFGGAVRTLVTLQYAGALGRIVGHGVLQRDVSGQLLGLIRLIGTLRALEYRVTVR